ncbi:ABC transporter ATP-binding protein [Desulfosporosinus sp. BICA1-9]|uniref:ABC transporter ATP-binding protein n=1 Tax=Desulfosporosinus sp. BICA1-9 TaxID=1531958 RepID=UPI00054B0622|nr:ABC transporter ATP-binding protein [Desulfosporosinus sp. BICA1-9]KJS50157.1 MAG: amino acid ABC transporter ATPase [Peptococcaceae bacterium BRH_c23]KJS80981.1 MAG: amino acid ABC transporter ATPase [Desulfosporosinus sp. BICA1-9]HBW37752.1 ABC transporter ATP-binding protein [Desulfosporosinus sp.]
MARIMEVENLEVVYGVIKALQGISFYIDEGEIVTIIGANGAGKSSTLRAVSGMVRPSSGKVMFKNKDITNSPSHLIARQGLSHVPEGRGMLTKLTVEENLILATYNRKDNAKVKEDMADVYRQFPRLSERKKQASGNLSGGEQQMLAIGRALMTGADTLLLDEPSMGLAPLIVKEIFAVIKRINQAGKTILLVEQNAITALHTAHRAYILENGAVLKSGKASELIDDPQVKAAYLGGH